MFRECVENNNDSGYWFVQSIMYLPNESYRILEVSNYGLYSSEEKAAEAIKTIASWFRERGYKCEKVIDVYYKIMSNSIKGRIEAKRYSPDDNKFLEDLF